MDFLNIIPTIFNIKGDKLTINILTNGMTNWNEVGDCGGFAHDRKHTKE